MAEKKYQITPEGLKAGFARGYKNFHGVDIDSKGVFSIDLDTNPKKDFWAGHIKGGKTIKEYVAPAPVVAPIPAKSNDNDLAKQDQNKK